MLSSRNYEVHLRFISKIYVGHITSTGILKKSMIVILFWLVELFGKWSLWKLLKLSQLHARLNFTYLSKLDRRLQTKLVGNTDLRINEIYEISEGLVVSAIDTQAHWGTVI